jgi:hypothetical protein
VCGEEYVDETTTGRLLRIVDDVPNVSTLAGAAGFLTLTEQGLNW